MDLYDRDTSAFDTELNETILHPSTSRAYTGHLCQDHQVWTRDRYPKTAAVGLTPPPVCPPSQVLIWNLDVGEPVKMIDCHSDVILCMSFNTDGSLLTTTCKDKKLRVIEPRSGRVLQVKPHFVRGRGGRGAWGSTFSQTCESRCQRPSLMHLACTSVDQPSVLGPSLLTGTLPCSWWRGALVPFLTHCTPSPHRILLACSGDRAGDTLLHMNP